MSLARYYNVGRRAISSVSPPFVFNNAWTFDGVNDTVLVPDAASLDFGTGDFCISTWVQLINTGLNQDFIVKRSGSGAGYYCRLDQVGRLSFVVAGAATFTQLNTVSGVFTSGVWQHLVFIRKGTVLNDWGIYVNGVNKRVASTVIVPLHDVNNAVPLRIMSNNSGAASNGRMDETTFYNKALSPAEVAFLYNGGLGNLPPSTALANLVARYDFNSATGVLPNPILLDSSGNGNNGTGQNFLVSPLVLH